MKFVQTFKRAGAGVVAVGGVVLAQASHAAGTAIDVTDVVSTISSQSTAVAAIGAAVLTLFVGIKAFKWVRMALS